MHLSSKIWSCLSYLASILNLSAFEPASIQQPLGGHLALLGNEQLSAAAGYPIFEPPGRRLTENGHPFKCEYPEMRDYEFCSEPEARDQWLCLKEGKNGTEYNLTTDYENVMPRGKTRTFHFDITDGWINADGLNFTQAKLVNNKYPGPYLQACWGDRIIVNVTNNLKHNGTAIHWHGMRQLNTTHMDGVPGITQCPIAPGDYFVYNFTARQYGSAWYHSHYSVQYADGMLGPLTIYGPHSSDCNEAKAPLLMTDWFHNSAYQVIHGNVPGYPTVLLNGTGDITKYNHVKLVDQEKVPVKNDSLIPPRYRLHFSKMPPLFSSSRVRRYLLSLINTSFDTGFVFSIDHHMLEVISADFVPIKAFKTTHLHVGIGQRYNVIVRAEPEHYPDGTIGDRKKLFWIRTTASECFNNRRQMPALAGYDQTGILSYYDPANYDSPELPTTKRWPQIEGDTACRDEYRDNFKPILEWKVGEAANKEPSKLNKTDEHDEERKIPGERFDVVLKNNLKGTKTPSYDKSFPLDKFSFERPDTTGFSFNPLQIAYNDPIFLHLNQSEKTPQWPYKWAVVTEDVGDGSWIYLALGGRHNLSQGDPRISTVGAHPIHLHGHDFAVLQQEEDLPLTAEHINIDQKVLNNPPRRDVVLLPANGFVVIAFKADNPGPWLMHCHIAFHASFGLAIQIMERREAALRIWPDDDDAIIEAERVCGNWKTFAKDCTKHWPGKDPLNNCYPACNNDTLRAYLGCANLFQDDSGI